MQFRNRSRQEKNVYDFWFSLGTAIIDPGFLAVIKKPAEGITAKFHFVERVVVELDDGNAIHRHGRSAGLLDEASTTAVRLAMAKYINGAPGAPPIGILAAGRFCQWVNIPTFDSHFAPADGNFDKIIALTHNAYVAALGASPAPAAPAFRAFLGLCLCDENLVFDFAAPTAALIQAASEFGVTVGASTEWTISNAFVSHPDFQLAQRLFMRGDLDPWDDAPTQEQIFFWKGRSEFAIP
jgi:hypothetical protein